MTTANPPSKRDDDGENERDTPPPFTPADAAAARVAANDGHLFSGPNVIRALDALDAAWLAQRTAETTARGWHTQLKAADQRIDSLKNTLRGSLPATFDMAIYVAEQRQRAELATTRAAEAERLLNELVDRVRELASGATKTIGWRCGWCGIDVGTVADADQGVEAGRAHSVACEKNPLVAQLAALQNCGADHATGCGGCVDGWRAVAEKERARAEKAERQQSRTDGIGARLQ